MISFNLSSVVSRIPRSPMIVFAVCTARIRGEQKAISNGTSIVIGHVGAEGGEQTAKAIKDTIPEIEKMGVKIVPLSEIYETKSNSTK